MTDTMGPTTDSESVSRRSLLKKLGVGTAVVWTYPVLSTIGVPAGAQQVTPGNACRSGVVNGGFQDPACTFFGVFCNPSVPHCCCECYPIVAGNQLGCCFCADCICGGEGCDVQSHCSSGQRCVFTNCVPNSGFKGVCANPCGAEAQC